MYYHRVRFPLMALAILALLSALWAGLIRAGWRLSLPSPTLTGFHGPLMVFGFLGTLVGLERAVALRRPWAYAAPLLTGLGSLALLTGWSVLPGPLLLLFGSLSLFLVLSYIIRLQPALHTVTVGLGSLVGLIGTGLWLAGGRPLSRSRGGSPQHPMADR